MFLYKTLAGEGTAETEILRSRFICHCAPAESEEAAREYIQKIMAAYRDATHNVPAMVIGDRFQIQWASDDGEPQGTSGAPIVRLLVEEGITNCVVVVTRYFGGTKLGTGGLVRAYTGCARLGIENAGIREVESLVSIRASVDYSHWDRLQKQLADRGFAVGETEFTDRVTLTVTGKAEREEELKTLLSESTRGSCVILESEEIRK